MATPYGKNFSFGATSGTSAQIFAGPTPSTVTFTEPPVCRMAGHTVDPPVAEYLDGLLAGYCKYCSERVTFPLPAGGSLFLRVKALMEMVLSDDCDRSLALGEFSELLEALKQENVALDEGVKLLQLAGKVLRDNRN